MIVNDLQFRPNEIDFWSYWLPWLGGYANAIYLVAWATLTTYSIEEQTRIRRVQFHPILETAFIKSVDPFGVVLPDGEGVPDEYSRLTANSPAGQSVETDFRYLVLQFRNQGQGLVTHIKCDVEVTVPGTSYRKALRVDEKVEVRYSEVFSVTVLPFWNLPRYTIEVRNLTYRDAFGEYRDRSGPSHVVEEAPYRVNERGYKLIFLDDFQDQPYGKGWVLDYWGVQQPSDVLRVHAPNPSQHVLLFNGMRPEVGENGTGAYIELTGLVENKTYEIGVWLRSTSTGTAGFDLWCHDVNWVSPMKDRRIGLRVPTAGGGFIARKMKYTATTTGRLRVHLHFSRGSGVIEIDKAIVWELHQ